MKKNLRVDFNHNFDPSIWLDPNTRHLDLPLETSLMPTKVKTKQKRRYKMRETASTPPAPMPSRPSSPLMPNVTPAVIGETVHNLLPPDAVLQRSSCYRHKKTTTASIMPPLGESVPDALTLKPSITITSTTGEKQTLPPSGENHTSPTIVTPGNAPFDPSGPTIVSDDETAEPTSYLPRRRSTRILKKRSILSVLATALSMMGGRPYSLRWHPQYPQHPSTPKQGCKTHLYWNMILVSRRSYSQGRLEDYMSCSFSMRPQKHQKWMQGM